MTKHTVQNIDSASQSADLALLSHPEYHLLARLQAVRVAAHQARSWPFCFQWLVRLAIVQSGHDSLLLTLLSLIEIQHWSSQGCQSSGRCNQLLPT